MKQLFTLAAFCFIVLTANAQGIYQYWGTASYGGDEWQGVIYTTKMNGMGFKMRPGPSVINKGSYPYHSRLLVHNNKFYSCLAGGGIGDDGIIMVYDPATGIETKLVDFYSIGAANPYNGMVLYNNKFYGTTILGGSNGVGVLFEFDPATNGVTKKFDFGPVSGNQPVGELLVYGTKLYGLTLSGGANGSGTLFEYDPATNTFTKKRDLLEITGERPQGGLAEFGGKLYGLCSDGGANSEGVLFEYDPATNGYLVRAVFGGTSGEAPYCTLALYNNKFYGQTSGGGNNSKGTLFEFDPVSNIFSTKYHYTDAGGSLGYGSLTAFNSKLYGLLSGGGTGGDGSLFEFDPATNIFVKKVDCSPNLGNVGLGTMVVYNSKLYGFMSRGGVNNGVGNNGVLFEYNPVGNVYLKKIEFRSNTGMQPRGSLTYFNGKVYGTTSEGGANGNGGLFEYDLATYTYTKLFDFSATSGVPIEGNGMIVYNNKLYGTLETGGANDDGTLYEFDPQTNLFTKKYDFENATGGSPSGRLVIWNNKFLGTTSQGGSEGGKIFEFDPATNNYAPKVDFSTTRGLYPSSGLLEYNGKFYGTALLGGANGDGTLFEYNPVGNVFFVRHHFNNPEGRYARGGLTLVNNKMFGMTQYGGTNDYGVIYEFDPASFAFTPRHHVGGTDGAASTGTMTYNESTGKIYGVADGGGPVVVDGYGLGVIFEFDPVTFDYSNQTPMSIPGGSYPRAVELHKTPAITAPGTPGTCAPGGSDNIDVTNNNQWVAFTNNFGDAVAEINANGNNLGRVQVNFYVHNGPTRSDPNGGLYLDRNITITVDNQPATPVSVRLYIRKTEFDKLKATPGSGVVAPADLSVFKNEDPCQAAIGNGAFKMVSSPGTWGGDYVYSTTVTSFSTFYFASRNITILPVNLLSFNGKIEAAVNKLEWKASCSNDVDFVIERSTDGVSFQQIGMVMALQQDCGNPFSFLDLNPPAKAWYRLQVKERNASAKYSSIILLNRDVKQELDLRIVPNPVTGSQANIQVYAVKSMDIHVRVSDATGRILLTKTIGVQAGVNTTGIDVSKLASGNYYMTWSTGEMTRTVNFIKQ